MDRKKKRITAWLAAGLMAASPAKSRNIYSQKGERTVRDDYDVDYYL